MMTKCNWTRVVWTQTSVEGKFANIVQDRRFIITNLYIKFKANWIITIECKTHTRNICDCEGRGGGDKSTIADHFRRFD